MHFHTVAKAPSPSFVDSLLSYPGILGGRGSGGKVNALDGRLRPFVEDEDGLLLERDCRLGAVLLLDLELPVRRMLD